MQRKFVALSFLASTFVFTSCAAKPAMPDSGRIKPLPQFSLVSRGLSEAIQYSHYQKPKINDSLSSVIFDRYFKDLDPLHMYFLASDLKEFEPYRTQLDDFLKSGDMSVPFAIFNRFLARQQGRFNFVLSWLKKKEDYGLGQPFEFNREKASWMKDSIEQDNYWKKRVEYDLLSLGLAQKDRTKNLSTLQTRYAGLNKQLTKLNAEDGFRTFMQAFTESIDPHTTYFSPQGKADFNIEMSKTLEGIGAVLKPDNEYIKIVQMTKGGPAEKSKKIFPNDKIVAVAQGTKGEFVDIIGWRSDEAVTIIRGPKGSIVRLKILSANATSATPPHVVELVRDKITLEDQRASGEIKEIVRNGKKYRVGVITLGDFYFDFDAAQRGVKDFNSASRDVKKILDSLNKSKVDGVVLDLRDNGGGSLTEAIQLTGLFITKGPVVQARNYKGDIDVNEDNDPLETYKGPFAVLINNFSASASEIFAAAIQDYGRGVIIGEQSYGKGTVQTAISINSLLRNNDVPLGQINLTTFKFYRINGSSTQRLGVMPDIVFPSKFPSNKFGEASEPSALPWDKIKSSIYTPMDNVPPIKEELAARHEARMKSSKYYKDWLADVADFKQIMETTTVPLNSDSLKATQEKERKRDLARYNMLRQMSGMKPVPASALSDSSSQTEKKKGVAMKPKTRSSMTKPSEDALDPDLLIKEEGYQVIADMVDMKENPMSKTAQKREKKARD